jgi:RNA 2',3'-cyclic 3'-phosphodiesterase
MIRSKRLFVGIGIPESCKKTLLSVDPRMSGLRWQTAEQLHLTLSFLGDVEISAEERLREALHAVRIEPFLLPLRGLGIFHSGDQVSIVWVGVGKGHPHLFALHRRVQDAVVNLGMETDLRPFHPHVTVGRAKGISREMLRKLLRQYADTEFGIFEVCGFGLYSSVLGSGGASYRLEMLREF